MTGFQEWRVDQPWLDTHCSLGEGPFYDKTNGTVRFVDIRKKRIHQVRLDKDISSLKTVQLDVAPTVTSNIVGVDPRKGFLIGVKYGIALLDWETGSYTMIQNFPSNERLRSNDGASDPHGRFWVGTMTDFDFGDCVPEGSLFRFNGKTGRVEIAGGLTIPNSVGWSPDKRTMYFTHSSEGQVLAMDYDLEMGTVSNQRVFYTHKGAGGPDGFRVDAEGNIWHAIYGESRVIKINTEGEVIGQISLPTRNITCVEFAGAELVITSAADEDGEDKRSREVGGAVFKVNVGIGGLDAFEFSLDAK